MVAREERELLRLARDNNRMLKEIVEYINFTNSRANSENENDFGRNVIANMVSSYFPGLYKR